MECKHSSSQNVKNYHFPFDSMKARMPQYQQKEEEEEQNIKKCTILKLNGSR